MKYIVYWVVGLSILSIAPQIILGIIFTLGMYYLVYAVFSGLFTSGGSGGGGGGSDRGSDPGDHWHGTGNPHM